MALAPLSLRPLEGFWDGRLQLDEYIGRVASQDARRGVASVFVLVDEGSPAVIGYYTLSAHSLLLSDLPDEFRARLPRYPSVRATLLGRLAVSVSRRGERLGKFLLMDALHRSAMVTGDVASAAVVVDAIDDEARAFYERYDFRPFADNPMKLYLPMATIRSLLSLGLR